MRHIDSAALESAVTDGGTGIERTRVPVAGGVLVYEARDVADAILEAAADASPDD